MHSHVVSLSFSEQYLYLYTLCSYLEPQIENLAAIERGVQEGRRGKGIIYVFAAGNSYAAGVTANMEVCPSRLC